MLLVGAVAFGLTPVAGAAEVDDERLQAAIAERAAFGSRTEASYVRSLIASPDDIGTPRWGIPLTREEERSVDVQGRMAFADAVHEELLPVAESLDSFAGAYFDQTANGRLVVLLTRQDATTEKILHELMPEVHRGLAIRYATYPYSVLHAAVEKGPTTISESVPGVEAINMPDWQASNYLFPNSLHIEGSRNPTTGETICAAMGNNPDVTYDCGIVADSWLTYQMTHGTTGEILDLEGADHDFIQRHGGDSGSPIIVDLGYGVARGVGLHSAAAGQFARLGDYLRVMDGSVVTNPG